MLLTRTGGRRMTPTLEALGIDKLTVDQKIELAQAIWDSVAAEVEKAPLTEAQKREIDRRLANHQANPAAARSWEDVEAELLARLGE
jgi:putative addiction module component (TIGR02574 family)